MKEDMVIRVPEEVFGVKSWECEVVSNNNVASFIKEFVVKLPEGEKLNFKPGSYAQIVIPKFDIKYSDMDIDDRFKSEWDKFKLWPLTCKNEEETIRAYSMANYPRRKYHYIERSYCNSSFRQKYRYMESGY